MLEGLPQATPRTEHDRLLPGDLKVSIQEAKHKGYLRRCDAGHTAADRLSRELGGRET